MTKNQQAIYDTIVAFKEKNDLNPTKLQLTKILGKSRALVDWHLQKMVEKGILYLPVGRPSSEVIIKIKK